jgi:hypothetical protein
MNLRLYFCFIKTHFLDVFKNYFFDYFMCSIPDVTIPALSPDEGNRSSFMAPKCLQSTGSSVSVSLVLCGDILHSCTCHVKLTVLQDQIHLDHILVISRNYMENQYRYGELSCGNEAQLCLAYSFHTVEYFLWR